jgi:uncharacterized membrane protein
MQNVDNRSRWLGCLCYVGFLVAVPALMRSGRSAWLRRHIQQGVALLFAGLAAALALAIIEDTIGRIKLLGLLVVILTHLGAGLAYLLISVLGFVKALSGESWRIPYLDELADRIPIEADEG